MGSVTLICTRHEEYRNCNSFQLLKLIEEVRPEVIFEELSQSNFDKSYQHETLRTLETSAIKQYIANHNITHIPVDTFPRTREFDESVDRLYSRLTSGITQEAFQLRHLIDQIQEIAGNYGFDFLNSSANDEYLNKLDTLKLKVLSQLNDERLYEIHRTEIQMIEDRENQILGNIYTYSKENQFKNGLMFIGSGHRRTILQLIKKFDNIEEVKLIWKIYPN